MHFSFASPWFLLLLLLVPCFFWCQDYQQRLYWSTTQWFKREHPLFVLERWVKSIVWIAMVIALAKPFYYESQGYTHNKGRNLVFAIDASGSMAQSGFDPKARFKSKYDATLDIVKAFIRTRYDDTMGAVVFGTFAYTASPLTYDLHALFEVLRMSNVGIAGESTAIGDALMQALRTLSFGKATSKVIILITDGYHNAGSHSPKEAVEKAQQAGVKIYTIGIGKKGTYDATLLNTIAKETHAKSYHAINAEALQAIFEDIGQLEPSPMRGENYLNVHLLLFVPLLGAMILIIWLWRRRSV